MAAQTSGCGADGHADAGDERGSCHAAHEGSFPNCRVIALTTFDDDEYVFDALRAGAVGYLLKDVSSEKLFEAIRTAARGEYFLQPSITAKVVSEFARIAPQHTGDTSPLADPLSSREMEVLKLVATGANNKEIAATLFIAEGTVKNHLTSILAKLQARDRMPGRHPGQGVGNFVANCSNPACNSH